MYNIRYLENNLLLHLNRRNLFYVVNILGLLVMVAIIFMGGPLLHETIQMGLMTLYNCPYEFRHYFEWDLGLNASVTPLCSLSRLQDIALYSVGILFALGLAFSFFLLGWVFIHRGKLHFSNLCLYLGIGFSLNPILYFFADTGNLINLLRVLGLSRYAYALPLIGSVFFGLEVAYSYVVVRHYINEYKAIAGKISSLRGFISDVNGVESRH